MRGAWQILNEVISEEDGFLCHIIESQSSKYTPGVLKVLAILPETPGKVLAILRV